MRYEYVGETPLEVAGRGIIVSGDIVEGNFEGREDFEPIKEGK